MNWFNISRLDGTAIVSINGWIGCHGVDAAAFELELGNPSRVELLVDSPGGDSTTALKVYDVLKGRTATAFITGHCCSSGVLVVMAADKVLCSADGRLMVHQPVAVIAGNWQELQAESELLSRHVDIVRETLVKRTGADPATVTAWLSRDTWFDASAALAAGLIDEIIPRPLAPMQRTAPAPTAILDRVTQDERLVGQLLTALGRVEVRDRKNFLSELHAWGLQNTNEVP